jgi:transposase
MSTARREFTDEFKREAVALWETSGRLQTEVAAELGIQPSQLRRWQQRLRGQAPRPSPTSSRPTTTPAMPLPADQASEIARLQRELDRTRLERDILKKALGICAEVPR